MVKWEHIKDFCLQSGLCAKYNHPSAVWTKVQIPSSCDELDSVQVIETKEKRNNQEKNGKKEATATTTQMNTKMTVHKENYILKNKDFLGGMQFFREKKPSCPQCHARWKGKHN